MTTPSYMPSARSHDTPHFKGKHVKLFLAEFDTYAKKAGLSDEESCRIVENYCSPEPAQYIRTLKSEIRTDWTLLKVAILVVYTQTKKEDHYMYATLDSFMRAKRNIKSIKVYNKYYRQFMSIVNPLTEKGKLLYSQYNELFFKGLRPGSLCLYVQHMLCQDGKCPKENRNAPTAEEVMKVVKCYLGGDKFEAELSDEEKNTIVKFAEHSSDSSDESPLTTEDEESEEEQTSFCYRKTKVPSTPKKANRNLRSKEREPDQRDAAMEELSKKLEHLAICIEKMDNKLSASSVKPSYTASARVCYMCRQNESHRMKDCPETIAFMASGIVKMNVDSRIYKGYY